MLIIGCDCHPGFQQIACVDTATGELWERRLLHREEAEQFYRKLQDQNRKARVGMELRTLTVSYEVRNMRRAGTLVPPVSPSGTL
jgi:hypothetical protein